MDLEIKEMDLATAYEKINTGGLLIDIREWEEVEMLAFDMEAMMQIPQSEMEQRFHEIPTDKEIIVGCHSGSRSLHITRLLMEKGFKSVYNLKGGIRDWEDLSFPVKWDAPIVDHVLRNNDIHMEIS